MQFDAIYIKPQRKKCEISDFRTFEIIAEDNDNKIQLSSKVADVIRINEHIGIDIVDGYIHIWCDNGFELTGNGYTVWLEEGK